MSEPRGPEVGRDSGMAAEEGEVRRLLERAGPRDAVPPEDLEPIKAAFRTAWQEHVDGSRPQAPRREPGRRSGRLAGWQLAALAASLLLVLGLGWWLWRIAAPAGAGPAARVESLAGRVTARDIDRGGREGPDGAARATPLADGAEVPAGAVLETAGAGEPAVGRAALRLAGGASLRLDAGSRVRLVSASLIELERGAVYLDSGGGSRRPRAVEVRTPLGTAREVGTQFEVRLLGLGEAAALRVRVREGAVRVDRSGGSAAPYLTGAGVELTLRADGSVARRRIAGHGAPWAWVLAAAPPLAIEGLTLQQFLDRVARETGWTIRYADPDLAASARSIVVHGNLGDLRPDEAPDVVLPGAGLRHELAGDVLIVRKDRLREDSRQ